MGFFNRPGHFTSKNFHSYISDDKVLENIGLPSYTRNGLPEFGMEQRNGIRQRNRDVVEYFGGSFPENALLGDSATLSCMFYDKEFNRYVLKTDNDLWKANDGRIMANSLRDFQEKFDLVQRGFEKNPSTVSGVNEVWANIQTSLSGCITFETEYAFLDEEDHKSKIKIFFQSGPKARTDREVAHKGNIFIAAPPATSYFMSYAHKPTNESPIGTYVPEAEGGADNPQNSVAGPVNKSWNPHTGNWEFGTHQVLARLLTDVDGISEKDLPPDLDNYDWYDSNSSSSMTEFKTGFALPVSVEKGNPHMFGPDIIGCDKKKVAKIVVTNRSPRQFRQGELVMCSLIGPDWIITPFESGNSAPKKFEASWSDVQKYIIDAKSFFRSQNDGIFVNDDSYAKYLRYNFYGTLGASIGYRLLALNLNPQPIESYQIDDQGKIKIPTFDLTKIQVPATPSRGGVQIFDADVLGKNIGGNRDESMLIKGNLKHIEPNDEVGIWATEVPNSWGMYFKDGYTATSVSKLKNNQSYISAYPNKNIYNGNGTFDFTQEPLLTDSFLYHLPAQIALNGQNNQSNLISLYDAARLNSNTGASIINYLKSKDKGDWIKNANNKDAFALVPVNPRSVQFTSLSTNLALSNITIPPSLREISSDQNGYKELYRTMIASYKQEQSIDAGRQSIGKARTREGGRSLVGFKASEIDNSFINTFIGFGDNLLTFQPNGSVSEFSKASSNRLPDGALYSLFPKIGQARIGASNVVGVIAAKSTLGLSTGGQLQLTTSNNFGQLAYTSATIASTNIEVSTTLNITSDLSGNSKSSRNVQYGSSNDQDDPKSFGTTSLYCKIYDHNPNTIYEGRFHMPIHFNANDDKLTITCPISDNRELSAGEKLTRFSNYTSVSISGISGIRPNMLLTGGGFYYINKIIAADMDALVVVSGGMGYKEGDIITFGGGSNPAKFKIGLDGQIQKDKLEVISYGQFQSNPFTSPPYYLEGTITNADGQKSQGIDGIVRLTGFKVIEQVKQDPEPQNYGGTIKLSRPDNDGGGDNQRGYVTSSKTNTVNLSTNSTGKYDAFFFYVNDIGNYVENSNGVVVWIDQEPKVQHIDLEMSVS
jgi:hypothetical protein